MLRRAAWVKVSFFIALFSPYGDHGIGFFAAQADSRMRRRPLATLDYEKDASRSNFRPASSSPPRDRSSNVPAANNRSSVILFVHIAKTGGSSFDEILKKGVNNLPGDCVVEKKHYDSKTPLEQLYDFPSCRIISTEFSRHQVSKFLLKPVSVPASIQLAHIKFITLLREPFSRLLSQYRHDKYYTPRVFKDCDSLDVLVQPGAACIQSREPAYRYQNFQAMMLGGCIWNHKTAVCEQVKHPAYKGGGFVTPREILAGYHFVGINEYFEASMCLFYDTVGDSKSFKKMCRGPGKATLPHVMRGSWITVKESSSSDGKAVVDASVLRTAVRTNELDFKLYWAAYDEFMEKVKALELKLKMPLI